MSPPPINLMKKSAIFIRVSTSQQEDNHSLPSQLEYCRRYAENNNLRVVKEFLRIHSASSDEREDLEDLIALAQSGEIEAVIFYDPSRFTRNVEHGSKLFNTFKTLGVEIHYYLSGQIRYTPEGKYFHDIQIAGAEYWKNKIVEGSIRGRIQKAKSGKWWGGGTIPYGYQKVGLKGTSDLEINEDEARVIRWIFYLFLTEDKPLKQITELLNSREVKRPKGGAWTIRIVRDHILKRRLYLGELSYKEIVSIREDLRIISDDLFQEAHEKLEMNRERKRIRRKDNVYPYMLAGRLFCTCGRRLVASSSNRGKNVYYVCSNYSDGSQKCDQNRLKAKEIDSTSWAWLTSQILSYERLEEAIQEAVESALQEIEPLKDELATVEETAVKKNKQLEDLLSNFLATTSDSIKRHVEGQIKRLGEEIDSLTQYGKDLKHQIRQSEISPENQKQLMEETLHIKRLFREGEIDGETKRAITETLNVEARLHEDHDSIELSCVLPPSFIFRISDTTYTNRVNNTKVSIIIRGRESI